MGGAISARWFHPAGVGEHHDNTFHHMLRAQLIIALASRKPTIVMEYLHRGEQLNAAAPLLDELQRTQFNLSCGCSNPPGTASALGSTRPMPISCMSRNMR